MSHFTSVRTRMTVAIYLRRALIDLGYEVEEGNVRIRGFMGAKRQVEMKVATASKEYDIGFCKSDDGYEMVADWWGIKGLDQKQLVRELTQRYAYHAACGKLHDQGFNVASEEKNSDGRIHLVLRRIV